MDNRIIFFGTPEFAVASLESLVKAGLNVVAVVTSLDKPSGRNMKLQESPVKQYAKQIGLPVLQPVSMKSKEFIEELASYKADIQVVVAFRMIPEVVWNMPPMGTINLHGSLLPKYRGAAPINWAIINGEKITGVTCFKLKHAIDTGNILSRKEIQILDEDDAGTLHDKMMIEGAEVLTNTIISIFKNEIFEIEQIESEVSNSPKLFKNNTIIDWNQNCVNIHNFIRGLSPYPCSYTYINDIFIKIYKSHFVEEKHESKVGSYDTDNKSYLRFACLNGWVYVDLIQIDGKKKMNIKDFLNGHRF
jgi:methionyl-tRNA formyltransferase